MMNIDRRDFLRGLSAFAFVGTQGCAGLTNIRRIEKDETLVAFLSDCHVGAWKAPGYQGIKFAECIARVLRLDPLPARMIIPGDVAYLWGRKEDYELARRLLQPVYDAGIDVTIGMGNHDRRENFLERWPEHTGRSPVKDRIVSVVNGKYFDYIMLDTLDQPVETDRWITPGKLEGEQREWLRESCARLARPFLVVAHHPAYELGDIKRNLSESAMTFGELILGKKDAPTKCIGFIHGHNHTWQVTRSLRGWWDSEVGLAASLPSTGHWGDIGYALLREQPDRAELRLVQYDYFSPKPSASGECPNPAWRAVVRDNANARCTFTVRRSKGEQ